VLTRAGHDVEAVADWSQDPGDKDILSRAAQASQVVVTLDKDFGELAVVHRLPHHVPYSLPDVPGGPKADVRRELERRLKDAIAVILGDQGARARADERSQQTSLINWATTFRDERIRQIANRVGVAQKLSSKHLVCVHAVPYGAVTNEIRLDLAALDPRSTHAAPIGATGYNSRFNADGLLRENVNQGSFDGYFQLFRNSIVESVDSRMMVGHHHGREDGLPAPFFAMSLSEFLLQTVRMWLTLGIAPPACILVTLSGLKGIPLILPTHPGYVTRSLPEDTMFLPEALITGFVGDPRPLLRHGLDVLWQAAGESRCDYFDSTGNWIGRL